MKTFATIPLAAAGLLAACAGQPPEAPAPAAMHFTDPADIDEAFPPALIETSFDSSGARLYGMAYLANGPGPHPVRLPANPC